MSKRDEKNVDISSGNSTRISHSTQPFKSMKNDMTNTDSSKNISYVFYNNNSSITSETKVSNKYKKQIQNSNLNEDISSKDRSSFDQLKSNAPNSKKLKTFDFTNEPLQKANKINIQSDVQVVETIYAKNYKNKTAEKPKNRL